MNLSSKCDDGELTPEANLCNHSTCSYNKENTEFYPNKKAFIDAENLYKAQNEKNN